MNKKEKKKDFFIRMTTMQLILFTLIFLSTAAYARFSEDGGEHIFSGYRAFMSRDMDAADFKALFAKEETLPPAEDTTSERTTEVSATAEPGTTNVFAFDEQAETDVLHLSARAPERASATFLSAQIKKDPVFPVSGRISSGYGGRISPIYNYSETHKGVDIAAASGSVIRAVADGVVSMVDYTSGRGNFLILDHGQTEEGTIQTLYQHCSEILVEPGAVIRAGEAIARVGSTGDSTGPHLHLEYRVDGECLDPIAELFGGVYEA